MKPVHTPLGQKANERATDFDRNYATGRICGHPDCPCTGGHYHEVAPEADPVSPHVAPPPSEVKWTEWDYIPRDNRFDWQVGDKPVIPPAPPAEPPTLLIAALKRIRDGAELCECEHDTPDCCNRKDYCCPFCIADEALRKVGVNDD